MRGILGGWDTHGSGCIRDEAQERHDRRQNEGRALSQRAAFVQNVGKAACQQEHYQEVGAAAPVAAEP